MSGSTSLVFPRPKADELVSMARHDFWCFVELMFPVLHPGQVLVHAAYLDVLAWVLMGATFGKYRRIVVNLPPRHMKSLVISILYVAWRLGRDPATKLITISYGDDLAHDHSGIARNLMRSPLYRRVFPGTVLDKQAVDHIRTTKGGHRYATSVGSDITGFGADVVIVDDPMQPEDATSESTKTKVREWVQSSVLTRFNDPARGVFILVMHRLAPDDLSATFEPDADCVLKLPLIAEGRERFTHNGILNMKRDAGDVLNPARMSKSDAEALRASLPRHVWDSQYQQRPTVGGSGMLSIDRFRRFDLGRRPAFELLIHSWDVGATINGNASVCTKWGLATEKDGREVLYLIDVVSLRLELPEVRAAVKSACDRDHPALVVLDERGVGLGLLQELRREGYTMVVGSTSTDEPIEREATATLRPSTSKIERFGRAALVIDDGRVVIPNAAPWLERFLYEVAAFPNIPDKDQVDSMTQLVANIDMAIRRARLHR